ncbi:MAG: hypothetical protein KC910_11980, partial [Candidatus Eremiobacteraeota bacterium]|nr:hypothetical protein [Candidatus Eremiobacteraeota bacterium]
MRLAMTAVVAEHTNVSRAMLDLFEGLEPSRRLLELVRASKPVTCSGVLRSARPLVIASLKQAVDTPVLWITPTSDSAERLAEDLQFFAGLNTLHFPDREVPHGEAAAAVVDPEQVDTLEAVAQGRAQVVVASIKAVLQKTLSTERLKKSRMVLRKGESLDTEFLLELLVSEGYHRSSMVERRGEFAQRGDIIDLFPITGEPVRVELFGDEVESLRMFDRDTQRSIREVEEVVILPATHDEGGSHLTDYLPRGTVACLEEPAQIRLHAMEWAHEGGGGQWGDVLALLTPMRQVFFTSWEDAEQRAATQETESLEFPFEVQRVFPDRVEGMMGRLPEWIAQQRRVLMVSRQAPRLTELMEERAWMGRELEPGKTTIVNAALSEGFRLPTPEGDLELLTDREMMGSIRRRRSRRKADRASLLRLEELNTGDLVVHLQHGIGRYVGVKSLDIQGNARDFLTIDYAKGDSLFV